MARVGHGPQVNGGRAKYWCLTLNNPTLVEGQVWIDLGRSGNPLVRYFVFQEEEGDAGTVHYQGYVQFLTRKRMTAVKRLFGVRVHCERSRGTPEQASGYCKKDDSRVDLGESAEWGTIFIPSKDKLVHALEAIREGALPSAVMEDYPCAYVQHRDGILDYSLARMGVRDWPMEVDVFVGPTGSGKSATAALENPGAYYVPWPTGGRWWWPAYEGQHCCIMDEFRMQIKMDVMLKLLDRYPMKLEAKGRSFDFVSRKIVLTTNIDPRDWYGGVLMSKKGPLQRRIREFCTIYDFTPGMAYGQFVKVARTELFTFRERVDADGDVEMTDQFGHDAGLYDDFVTEVNGI